MTAYDTTNILAKILRHEIPSVRVYEDDQTLGIMDIMPRTQGHMLVIPKAPVRNILDDGALPILPALIQVVSRLARAAHSALGADGIGIEQFSEHAAGQSIFHLHVHILPRWKGIPLRPPMAHREELQVLEQQAKRIAEHLKTS
jgi:histidine triad (HIT) family protein